MADGDCGRVELVRVVGTGGDSEGRVCAATCSTLCPLSLTPALPSPAAPSSYVGKASSGGGGGGGTGAGAWVVALLAGEAVC